MPDHVQMLISVPPPTQQIKFPLAPPTMVTQNWCLDMEFFQNTILLHTGRKARPLSIRLKNAAKKVVQRRKPIASA